MSNDNDIPNEVKKILIEQEIAMHKNTAWLVQVRHNVNKKLGATAEELKPLVEEIIKHEQSIDLLKLELPKAE